MMNYKGFSLENAEQYVSKYGFSGIEQNAFIKLVLTIEVIVHNLLNNVLHIVSALNVKTVKKQHFEAVMSIIKANGGSMIMNGGHAGTVMASEYYGNNSGRYFDNVSANEGSAYADGFARAALDIKTGGHAGTVRPGEYYGSDSGRYFDNVSASQGSAYADGLARAGLEIKVPVFTGGAMSFVNKENIKTIVDAFKKSKHKDFKMSATAYDIIITCVNANLDKLMKATKAHYAKKNSKSKVMTLAQMITTLKQNSTQFAHLSHIWKN